MAGNFKVNNNDFDSYFIPKGDIYTKFNSGIWSWGFWSGLGQGEGVPDFVSIPTRIGTLSEWVQIDVGTESQSAAIKANGTLWTWGWNDMGALGLNDTTYRYSPTQVGSLTNWLQVSCSCQYYQMAAIKTDGTLWTWGANASGRLGLGDTTNRSSPVQVGSLTNWKQVAVGYSHMAAIKTDGTLWVWGSNESGQLGTGTVSSTSSPVQVGSLTNWKQVAAGTNHTAAIKTDGTLWYWGIGQLGPNTTRSSPVQIGSLTNWKQVDVGPDFTIAVKTDGTIWSWGTDPATNDGQLGLGDITPRTSPVQVGSLTNWKQVSCGQDSAVAVKTDGTLWSWGRDNGGNLGLGSSGSKSSPVQIGSLTNWKQAAAGAAHMLAIKYG